MFTTGYWPPRLRIPTHCKGPCQKSKQHNHLQTLHFSRSECTCLAHVLVIQTIDFMGWAVERPYSNLKCDRNDPCHPAFCSTYVAFFFSNCLFSGCRSNIRFFHWVIGGHGRLQVGLWYQLLESDLGNHMYKVKVQGY